MARELSSPRLFMVGRAVRRWKPELALEDWLHALPVRDRTRTAICGRRVQLNDRVTWSTALEDACPECVALLMPNVSAPPP
jgi:hypothetical protein